MTNRTRRPDRRQLRPSLEGLEDRKLLYATLGANWVFGSRITYSFVPDGTNIGGTASNLNQTLTGQGYTTASWQSAFEKAASVWEAATNINLALVSDNGEAYGAAGNQQDDPNVGDIRIGGTAMNPGVLASTFLPPAFNGGALAGDVVMNTSQNWNPYSGFDLETVAIHEIGHALGLGHSALSSADMYAYFTGVKQLLTSDDRAGIQAVYGARQKDAFNQGVGNHTSGTATNINSYLNASAQASLSGLDITTNSTTEWFVVTAPANTTSTLSVTMQSTNLSSLSPKVQIYNGSLQGLAQVSAPNVDGATITATIHNVVAGQTYYIHCMPANGGPSGVGGYGLNVNFGVGTMAPISPPNTVVASQPDQGGGSLNLDGTDGTITIGSLTAPGDGLEVSPGYAHHHSHQTHDHAHAHAHDAAIHAWKGR